ncbi:MAG: hypothetical protein Q8Q09_10385 [Deltaproteobacteria bacterium]|nr:hypothetical protein [Deltaproteobacteria bacterium]
MCTAHTASSCPWTRWAEPSLGPQWAGVDLIYLAAAVALRVRRVCVTERSARGDRTVNYGRSVLFPAAAIPIITPQWAPWAGRLFFSFVRHEGEEEGSLGRAQELVGLGFILAK